MAGLNIVNKRKSPLSPEENERRLKLWRQGLTDSEIAKVVGCHPGSIRDWRNIRGLPPNGPAIANNLEFSPGERLEVGLPYGRGEANTTKWHRGTVLEVYPRFTIVQLEKYRVTVSPWELKEGSVKVRRLERKAG
ncbi:helix-turn-helix domain-containing protein [Moorella sp. E306M]|uniref:helix-turn-helix domain-containing protein n=1 Tax=Moorella sp. E306M TaxID=2572683 RepID=UPI0010FFAC32|nr:helix-turn-helix domain-containing protein [Moorella sp. E306M]GEA17763.1 hypothetical protein E306M_08970 [Moorella sp. E306M]GEA17832.1 hypothetical protein E306M_09660 [Moorella sp. E306M]